MQGSPVFGHPAEPSPRDVLTAARAQRVVGLRAAHELLAGAEHYPGDHERWRFNIERHKQAIAAFDAALNALPT